MAYTTDNKKQFIADYTKALDKAMSMGVPDSTSVSAEDAFQFYCATKALKATQMNASGEAVPPCQVFGRLYLDDTDKRICQRSKDQLVDIGIDIYVWQNFNSLKLNEWNMAVNDVWVVGGVNGSQPFYAASPVDEKRIIDPRFTPPLTIMGRELVGLVSAGYREAHNVKLGKAYDYTDQENAQKFSLVDYERELSSLKNVFLVKGFLKAAGIVI